MQRPTGGPDRGGYRPPTREELATERRRSLRRTGVGLMIGGAALAGLGTFTSVDAANHVFGQPTLVEHILPFLSPETQFNVGYAGIALGGVAFVSGIGFIYANQEPS